MRISIVIPALDEEFTLPPVLERARAASDVEILVVDGGSMDGTVQTALGSGARVLVAKRGRAAQMNEGARAASGGALLFLHADTLLPVGFDEHVRRALSRPDVAAGAFLLGIELECRGIRCIERLADWRSRLFKLPYGDQAVFVRAEVFRRLGGFPELPIMEDFAFMRRVRRFGRIAIVRKRVLTSGRRWAAWGLWKTTMKNQVVILSYLLRVSPNRIAARYRKTGGPRPPASRSS